MKILVTGGCGYIGSVLVPRLLLAGHDVHVIDNLSHGTPSLLAVADNPAFTFTYGDARDERLLKEAVGSSDVIIPLAALVGAVACDRDPVTANSVNFGAIQLLNRLRDRHQAVIFPMTNSGYGTKMGNLYCTEETPLEPITLYGRTKVAAEQELLGAGDAIALRLATVFGVSPRMRLDLLVNNFVYEAVTKKYLVIFEKDFKRNYIHIKDVADCVLHCIKNFDSMKNHAYNCGLDGANCSKQELADKIREAVPELYIHYSNIRSDPDKRNYIVSNEKLRRTGYEAHRSLEVGISELIKAYRMLSVQPYCNA